MVCACACAALIKLNMKIFIFLEYEYKFKLYIKYYHSDSEYRVTQAFKRVYSVFFFNFIQFLLLALEFEIYLKYISIQ